MSIFRSAVNKPVTTALIFLAFAILGVFALMRLPVDNLPDMESNTIMVMSSYPGASAEDVENNLTKVLENSLNGVSNLKDITSNSRENISVLTLEFEYGTDIDFSIMISFKETSCPSFAKAFWILVLRFNEMSITFPPSITRLLLP